MLEVYVGLVLVIVFIYTGSYKSISSTSKFQYRSEESLSANRYYLVPKVASFFLVYLIAILYWNTDQRETHTHIATCIHA